MNAARAFVLTILVGPAALSGCSSDDNGNPSTAASTTGSAGTYVAGSGGASSESGTGGGSATSGARGTETGGTSGGAAGAMQGGATADGSAGQGGMDDGSAGDRGDAASGTDATAQGAMSIFDGKTLNGWDGMPGIWSVKDGAIDGASNTADKFPGTFLISKGDYSNFRLMLTERVVVSNDHLGVCMWGNRLAPGNWGAGKCLVVIPPDGSMWDYGSGAIHGAKVGNAGVDSHTWHNIEIVAHRDTGEILMAVNGVQVTKYKDDNPSRLPNGPIRLQLHAWTGPQEVQYKDITIEPNPKEFRLITLH